MFSLESEDVSTIENIHNQVLTLFGIFDGHDELKPYGFSIDGGINGFSRRVLWLEVSTSNKMPEVIAKYYLDAVKRNGLPVNVKADGGTEHSLVQPIHLLLRNIDGSDPYLESFSIVTSPANQKIEAFWSILFRDKIGWWKRFFQDVVDLDLFLNDDPVLLEAIRFCFVRLLRKELKEIASDWNVHIIESLPGPRVDLTQCIFYHIFTTDKT